MCFICDILGEINSIIISVIDALVGIFGMVPQVGGMVVAPLRTILSIASIFLT